MTHVVTDACIRCKYMDCVEFCPVECFHEGETMLVIDPDACIDCALCVPECPADAIVPDIDKDAARWLELNATYSASWPNIARRKAAPPDADSYRHEDGKFEKYFSAKPASDI
jgi:ferredoxin